jgi:HlyD family secretion protein
MSLRRWVQHKFYPRITAVGTSVVNRLTSDDNKGLGVALKPSRRWSAWIIWTLVGVASFGFVWSCVARVDETVQATGKLEPQGANKEVKAPLGGVVKAIYVKEGQAVQPGEVMLDMDTSVAKAKLAALILVRDRIRADLLLSKGQLGESVDVSRLSSNQIGKLTALRSEYASRMEASSRGVEQARAAAKEAETKLRSKQNALLIREQILEDIGPLVNVGAMARSQYKKELQEVILLRGEVRGIQSEVIKTQAALAESIQRMSNTRAMTQIDFRTKVEEGEKQLAELSNQINETQMTLRYQKIVAPVRGVVFDMKPTSPGYLVNSDTPVLKVIPTDKLVARVYITNRDIGFVRVGQAVKVRIDAYPSSEFGEVPGKVQSIGSDVLPPDESVNYYRFPVTVALDRPTIEYRGRKLSLLTGMSISANIILRKRPVIAIFTQSFLPFWDSLEKL